MGLLLNLLILIGFAFLARGLLGARNVTWLRVIVAALIAEAISFLVAVLIVVGYSDLDTLDASETQTLEVIGVAALFEIPITMGIVVAFELVSSRPRRPRRLRPVNPVHALRRRVGLLRRGTQVTRVATRHGFGAVAGRRNRDVDPAAQARELRLAIEELGGVYIKLGQLLATRPDLLPPEAITELRSLTSSTTPLPFPVIEEVLRSELGDPSTIFATIEPEPLGSASIAQAHAATLLDGSAVVIKVQRPGLEDEVERDLAILDWATRNLEKRSARARTYGARQLADEFAQSMTVEMDFRNEAIQVESMKAALTGFGDIAVPEVFDGLTTSRVLVMERLLGTPLGALPTDAAIPNREQLASDLARSQLSAMLNGGRFHGDPHPGNVLLLHDGGLGLIDFGMTGRLDTFGRAFVMELLAGIHLEEPSLVYEALLVGGSVDAGTDREELERSIASFMAAHTGSDMLSEQSIMELMTMAAELGAAFPRDAAVMLRAVATLIGTLDILQHPYPLVEQFTEIAGDELQSHARPQSLRELAQREVATLAPFVKRLPRHVDRIASQIERGELRANLSVFSSERDVAVLERLLNRALLTVIGLGILALSVLLVQTESGPTVAVSGFYLTQLLGWTGLFAGTALTLRALLDVLRPATGASSKA